MPRNRTLVIVLAGGAGGRLELLTRERAKPAVPYAGTHRLIDFPLSNCHNAGLSDVWISQQFNPMSLSDHLANGRPWDLDRTIGGLLTLQPRLGHDDRGGFQRGTADALWRNAPLIREHGPEALVVVSADAVYACDYGALVEEHMEADAAVTMVTTEVDPDDAGRYGVVQVDGGKVVDYAYKPDDPAGNLVANEVFVFRPDPLLDTLEQLADEAGEDELEDLGHELLPRLVDAGAARESRFEGYWRDVGTVDAYWDSHMDLLRRPAADRPRRPGLAGPDPRRAPARPGDRARRRHRGLAGGAGRAGRGLGVAVGGGPRCGRRGRRGRARVGAAAGRGGPSGARVARAVLDDAVEIGRDVAGGRGRRRHRARGTARVGRGGAESPPAAVPRGRGRG